MAQALTRKMKLPVCEGQKNQGCQNPGITVLDAGNLCTFFPDVKISGHFCENINLLQ